MSLLVNQRKVTLCNNLDVLFLLFFIPMLFSDAFVMTDSRHSVAKLVLHMF